MIKVDSQLPVDWFERAEKDLASARHLLKENEITFIIPASMLLQ